MHIVALAITGVLFFVARAEGCPDDVQAQQATRQSIPLALPAGCVAPYDGKLLNRKMRDANRAAFAQKDALLGGTLKNLEQARLDLATCRDKAATALDDCSAEIPVVSPTSSSKGWIWAAAGSGAALGPLATCRVLDCGSEATPWVAAATGSAVVALLAWVVE